MLRSIFLLSVVLIGNFAYCQFGTLKGVIQDSATKKGLPFASVTIYNAQDTSLISYQLSARNGEFDFKKLPQNKQLRLVISFVGYKVFRREFEFKNNISNIDLGYLLTSLDPKYLESVTVYAERPPIAYKDGIIEFNASSFRTLPDAIVEDLLKKMPGIQIDRNGEITTNGKRVTRITVDGKYYFSDDIKIATRNLPANIIENVQISPDKEELERNPEIGLGNVGSVINLTLKKSIKKKWFGKLYAGIGTGNHFELGGIANLFKDTTQIAILGFSNNVNKNGFTIKDLQDLGGFTKNTYSQLAILSNNENGLLQSNSLQYFNEEVGISNSTGAGVNINYSPRKSTSSYIQYFYGHRQSKIQEDILNQQFNNDTIITTQSLSDKLAKANNQNINFGGDLTTKSLFNIRLRVNYSFINGKDLSNVNNSTTNNKVGDINSGDGIRDNALKYNDFNQSLSVVKRFFGMEKRRLIFTQTFLFKGGQQKSITEFINQYFIPTPSVRNFNQFRDEESPFLRGSILASFIEPLSKKLTGKITSQVDYYKELQDIKIYEKLPQQGYDSLNSGLSNTLIRTYTKFNNTISLDYEFKKATVTLGANLLSQTIDYTYSNSNYFEQHISKLFPFIRLNWGQNFIGYNSDIILPFSSYVIPVPDSTNPLYIRLGNPTLSLTTQHQIQCNLNKINTKKWTYYNFTLNSKLIENDIILSRIITQQGTQIIKPVNSNGSFVTFSNLTFGKDFKQNPKFTYSIKLNLSGNYDNRKILINYISGTQRRTGISSNISLGISWPDKFEVQTDYQLMINKIKYSNPYFRNTKIREHSLNSTLIVHITKHVFWESSLTYKIYTTTETSKNEISLCLLNMSLTSSIFKQKALLKFTVFDILDKNIAFTRFSSQNYFTEIKSNVLHRFGLVTLIYTFKAQTTKIKT